jgi:hypothetical protein
MRLMNIEEFESDKLETINKLWNSATDKYRISFFSRELLDLSIHFRDILKLDPNLGPLGRVKFQILTYNWQLFFYHLRFGVPM